MHAPDGFFNAGVNVASGIISGGVLLYAVRKTYKNLDRQRVYMMAAVAAFIFAVQMLNFTVSAGTSGHLLGGVTAAIMLGPWAGTIVSFPGRGHNCTRSEHPEYGYLGNGDRLLHLCSNQNPAR